MITNLRCYTYDYKTESALYNVFDSSDDVDLFKYIDRSFGTSLRLSQLRLSLFKDNNPKPTSDAILDKEYAYYFGLSVDGKKNRSLLTDSLSRVCLRINNNTQMVVYTIDGIFDDISGYKLFHSKYYSKTYDIDYDILSVFIDRSVFKAENTKLVLSLFSEIAEYDVNQICKSYNIPMNKDNDQLNYKSDIILRDKISISDAFFIFDYISLIVIDLYSSIEGCVIKGNVITTKDYIPLIPLDFLTKYEEDEYNNKIGKILMDIIEANVTYLLFNNRITLSDDRVRISRDIYNFLNCAEEADEV
jgi:hypothetical protein